MDFRFIKPSCILFLCISFIFICCDGHKSSLKDIQVVWASDYSEDGLDNLLNSDTTYLYPNNTYVLKDSMKFYALSDKEFSLAKDILKNYFDYHLYDRDGDTNGEPFRQRKYFRQYIGYTEDDSLFVYVNLYTHFPIISDPECLCTIGPSHNILVYQGNGGRNYVTAIINMNKKSVVSFRLSNTDSNYIEGHYSEQELRMFFPE